MIKEVSQTEKVDATAELVELSYLVLCVNQPFQLCCKVQTREETIEYVDSAVEYSKRVLKRCEAFLVEKEADSIIAEEGDETSISWKKWLTTDRKQVLTKLCSDVKSVVNILSLALTTVNLKIGKFDPSLDLLESKSAKQTADDIKFNLDCGRKDSVTLALGEVYEFVQTPVKRKPGQKTKDLVNKGYANVCATSIGNNRYRLTVMFCREPLEENEDDASQDIIFDVSSKSFNMTKQRKKDLEGGILCSHDDDEYDLCYGLRQDKRMCYLIFESPGGVSAQTFEEFITKSRFEDETSVDKLSNFMDNVQLKTPVKN